MSRELMHTYRATCACGNVVERREYMDDWNKWTTSLSGKCRIRHVSGPNPWRDDVDIYHCGGCDVPMSFVKVYD